MNRVLKTVICFVVAALVCAAILPLYAARADEGVQALFINVGKADAALLFIDDQRFLVDTGTKGSYPSLKQALDLYNVKKLDGVIITHMHNDHVGGLKKLMKSGISVERLYAGKLYQSRYEEDHTVRQLSEDYQLPLTWLAAGDTIPAGDSSFAVLGPLRKDEENENNNSLVLDLQTPQGNILLAGDMEMEEEIELLDQGLIPQATVFKVAHHGEDDATGKRLVLQVRPQWAVISTSTAEEPDTPDNKIMTRLWEVKAGVAVTQSAEVGILITLRDGQATAEQIDRK